MAADDAAAVRDDQGAVGEPGFVAGERAAPERVPDPELVEWAERRSFTAKCKLEILAKLEAGTRLGEVGELLRREGLYTSHLTYWRKQVRDGASKELGRPPRGKPADRAAPQCAKLVGERVPARTTAFVFDRPDHPGPHRRQRSVRQAGEWATVSVAKALARRGFGSRAKRSQSAGWVGWCAQDGSDHALERRRPWHVGSIIVSA